MNNHSSANSPASSGGGDHFKVGDNRLAEELQAAQYLKCLESRDVELPTADAFIYLRDRLFKRQLLRCAASTT